MASEIDEAPRSRSGLLVAIAAAFVIAFVMVLLMSGCAWTTAKVSDITRSLNGVGATVSTYDQYGNPIDNIHGVSIQVGRNSDFDSTSTDSNGAVISNKDSEVLRINVGGGIMYHVGSSMCVAQDGVDPISNGPTKVELDNFDRGHPWLNNFFEKNRNLWGGRAKTIIIRSQNGTPIKVYAGNKVEIYATDIPKSTRFQVDNKLLLCYRVDYSVVDTQLLVGN